MAAQRSCTGKTGLFDDPPQKDPGRTLVKTPLDILSEHESSDSPALPGYLFCLFFFGKFLSDFLGTDFLADLFYKIL